VIKVVHTSSDHNSSSLDLKFRVEAQHLSLISDQAKSWSVKVTRHGVHEQESNVKVDKDGVTTTATALMQLKHVKNKLMINPLGTSDTTFWAKKTST
jgi:RNase P/RNase MRP subunit POP5